MPRKWWDVARSDDEIRFFEALARNPKYVWRTVDSLMKELGWSSVQLNDVSARFVKDGVVILKHDKKDGTTFMSYWERADDEAKNKKKHETLDGGPQDIGISGIIGSGKSHKTLSPNTAPPSNIQSPPGPTPAAQPAQKPAPQQAP